MLTAMLTLLLLALQAPQVHRLALGPYIHILGCFISYQPWKKGAVEEPGGWWGP